MAFYVVDVRDRVIQRVTKKYAGADNARYFFYRSGLEENGMGQGR